MINQFSFSDKWLLIILFAIAGLTIFLTEPRDGGAIDGSISSGISAHGMTLSRNLIHSDHSLFMFSKKELQNGKIVYDAYNRFPVFPFLLTGLLTSPFDHNLSFQIYIARQIMNLFFFLSIIIVYKLINMLTDNKYLALSVALITFSSYYLLTFKDLIFNDIPSLLGFVIALHGVVKSQKQRLKVSEIIFYSMFPICLGWQPYAVFTSWVFVDLLDLFKRKKLSFAARLSVFRKQPSLVILGTAIIWGIFILGFQLLNEWRIVGGSFINLPSVNSGLWRSGLSSATGHTSFIWSFNWLSYLPGQCHSMILMLIPFWPVFQVEPGYNAPILIVVLFILYTFIKFFKNEGFETRIFLIMTLSGLFWTIPMRHFVALHDFQSIFYVGFVISIYTLMFSRINNRPFNLLALNIALFFLISAALTNYHKTPFLNRQISQFKNISSKLPEDSKVYFEGVLNGKTRYVELILSDCIFAKKEQADYVITQNTDTPGKKLTCNQKFNLFKVPH